MNHIDIAILGAGAAGLAAAIFAGEAARGTGLRIAVLDGARKPGAKILVSGGGRCNVTNEEVRPEDYWGAPPTLTRRILRAFPQGRTLEWMRDMGVELKLEPTGKYFPVTDSARTVLDALLTRTRELGVDLLPGFRIVSIQGEADGAWLLEATEGRSLRVRHLILATGGLSLPKSGSDGWGIAQARRLGHRIIPTTPALSPLLLADEPGAFGAFAELSGLAIQARLRLADGRGKLLFQREGAVLFTHFGISGPEPLNMSRHVLRRRLEEPTEPGTLWLEPAGFASAREGDRWLLEQAAAHPKRTAATTLDGRLPARLAALLAGEGERPLSQWPKADRLAFAGRLYAVPLSVTGDRGYSFAETTAGGVDLAEVDHVTMISRRHPSLSICGEMLDVDGRIGGFNFQWAWASGYLAGRGAVRRLLG